jgi:hypothetical protein
MQTFKPESDPRSLYPTGTLNLRRPRLGAGPKFSIKTPKPSKVKMPKPAVKPISLKAMVPPKA